MSNVECRIKEFYLFYLLKLAERSDIHNSTFDHHHSSFMNVSYEHCRTMTNFYNCVNTSSDVAVHRFWIQSSKVTRYGGINAKLHRSKKNKLR